MEAQLLRLQLVFHTLVLDPTQVEVSGFLVPGVALSVLNPAMAGSVDMVSYLLSIVLTVLGL